MMRRATWLLAMLVLLAAGRPAPLSGALSAPPVAGEPVSLDLAAEAARQFQELATLFSYRSWFEKIGDQAYNTHALILPADRDPVDVILRRTAALLADVRRLNPARDFRAEEQALKDLQAKAGLSNPQWEQIDREATSPPVEKKAGKAGKLAKQDRPSRKIVPLVPALAITNRGERYELFRQAFELRRRIALANPLLAQAPQLLLVKNSLAWPGHICDQFFGSLVHGSANGGLFVLSDPFGPQPRIRNLLAGAVVTNGRLKGLTLQGGSLIAPDVSYDGKTILFTYSQCQSRQRFVTLDSAKGIWDPAGAYHLFKVGADGTNLQQLSDGQWNDIHPCWLPSGRVAFISERRGGYGRCHGRPVPTYTLFGMRGDGQDIVPLSYHETNEWFPSVNNDGMVVYTRWDYVDRGDCIAHHPWITTPDGRDPRVIQGNYPVARTARPDAETNLRAIPGSRKYVATAAPHHGRSFGSLVIVDPSVPDDGAMGPVRRLTPEAAFPEVEQGPQTYGTAWPLSETYFLCSRAGGIYLIDAFGNAELIYRDPAISCISPMPLSPRRRPPIVPHGTSVGLPEGAAPSGSATANPKAGVATCANVYNSLFPWPANTRIKALRIVQLFPKTTPDIGQPNIGFASESLARGVLGTVPVEEDGSVSFELPAGKLVYFQALDEKGAAVQSMMSATYVHPGERLTCSGCHAPQNVAPTLPKNPLQALQKAPSTIKPEVGGLAWPLFFPRLVEPVLEKNCIPCHARSPRAPKLITASAGSRDSWSLAYSTLSRFAFGLNGKPPSNPVVRSVPGQFGARASRLYKMLTTGHHDVKLSDEELRRITVWLDCNSNFYGAYEKIDQQNRGRLVLPSIE